MPTSCGVGECAGSMGNLICVSGVPVDTCDPFAGVVSSTIDAVGFDSSMVYLANSSDPGLSGLEWTELTFDDSTWLPGSYGIGYEENAPGASALLQTSIPSQTQSVFTRTAFFLSDASSVIELTLGREYDDGVALWINGQEVFRSFEMPAGDPDWSTEAGSHESSNGATPDFGTPIVIPAAGLPLQNGQNVLAVGVWNTTLPSSDLVLVPSLSITSMADVCDGLDTDCDGAVDEDFIPQATTCGVGECSGNTGQLQCQAGALVDTCDPLAGATPSTILVDSGSSMKYLVNSAQTEVVLVEAGASMRYLANQADPGLVGLEWTDPDFDDASWDNGAYGVGYEANPPGAENLLTTTVPPGTFSVFTRAEFNVVDATQVTSLLLGVEYDDGYVAWLNGQEVFRSTEMPAGDPVWSTSTTALHESSNGATPDYSPIQDISTGLGALQTGQNVLAIGVWNRDPAADSTDLVLVPRLAIGLDPGMGWTAEAFDDAPWADGTYGVGYESNPPGAENLLQTTVTPGVFSVFTRTRFNLADAAAVSQLLVSVDYDDGYVAWINGMQVAISPEMPSGPLHATTSALTHESSNGPMPDFSAPLDISVFGIPALHDGENVLAIGIWNDDPAATSTDLVLAPRLMIGSEVCDGLDNDCDGVVDNDADVVTTCGVGECGATGVSACVNGMLQADTCTPGLPSAELCDGLDNNCDGAADEGFVDSNNDGEADCVDPDDDGDGVPDVDDCHPLDPSQSAGPMAEVSNLLWTGAAGVLTWDSQGALIDYDLATGPFSALPVDGGMSGASCLTNDLSVVMYDDTRPDPPLGEGYYYAIRPQKPVCGQGTYGYATSGAERLLVSDCP